MNHPERTQVEGKVWLAGNKKGREHQKNKEVQWDYFTYLIRMGAAGKGTVASVEKDQIWTKHSVEVSKCWRKEECAEG